MERVHTHSIQETKRIPVTCFDEEHLAVCLELLAVVYEESSIFPVALIVENSDDEDYLKRKYIDQVRPLILEVKGEIVFPPLRLFDSNLFIFNYKRFYDSD